MKIIEGLKPYEVMRLHEEEGKRVAISSTVPPDFEPMLDAPTWDWSTFQYAIIDDSQPEIDWEGFDWEFFNRYGGARCHYGHSIMITLLKCTPDDQEDLTPVESPFYPWFGGKCPVPENVEVEVVFRDINTPNRIVKAGNAPRMWLHNGDGQMAHSWSDIIAFRLTGRVL